jgi:hypothetical protein
MRGIAVAMILLSCSGQLHQSDGLRAMLVSHLQVPDRRWQGTACSESVKSQLRLVNDFSIRRHEEANIWRPRS